ncbi:collagen alpha-5(VI) chain [Exaiptasia diaphana]|uniref:VWFA domain-containing protein n=1 Tax=Exaiptasia diaphana TaxID=2652724 RepID=A0A913XZM1_EXADI|nr:collagen alpha-5(VI) chain [Exaiptasia diaphana]KXJ23750.1 Collagen alpha-1(XII) chain [Exaiptasia diaphana]
MAAKWMFWLLCGFISFNMMSFASGAACNDIIDIGIIIDSSGSMGVEWLVSAMAFATQLADNFTIGYDETRFALITFSKEAKIEFLFKDYKSREEVELAVEKVEFGNSSTRIDKALSLALNEVFSHGSGTRTSASRFLVIASDGRFPRTGIPTFESMVLPIMNLNVEVLVVGIGDGVLLNELNALALHKKENVYPSSSDLNLDNMVNRIRSLTNVKCRSLPI